MYELRRADSPDPETFVLDDNILSWGEVEGATKYLVSINDGDYFEVETNQVTIPDDALTAGTIVTVIAGGEEGVFNSLPTEYELDIEVIPKEITLGSYVLPVVEFTASAWLRHADPEKGNDPGAQWIQGIVVVNGVHEFANLDDNVRLFSGGYAAVLDADFKVKYIVDRWAHEWNAEDGWTVNDGGWDWALNLKASYFKPYLEEGDMLIMASQYGVGLGVGTYRNVLGNELIYNLGTLTTDHRNVDIEEARDPSEVAIQLIELK